MKKTLLLAISLLLCASVAAQVRQPIKNGILQSDLNANGFTLTNLPSLSLTTNTAYGPSWNGSLAVTTRDAVYDKIETLVLGGAPFVDSTAIIKGSGNASKLFRIEVDGLAVGTTVMTPPNYSFQPASLMGAEWLRNKTINGLVLRVGTSAGLDKALDIPDVPGTSFVLNIIKVPDYTGENTFNFTGPTRVTFPREGVLATVGGIIYGAPNGSRASNAQLDLDAAGAAYRIDVTGVEPINGMILAEGETRLLRFTGAGLTITPGASLLTPGGAVINTALNGVAVVKGGAGGVVEVLHYETTEGYSKQTFSDIFMNPDANIGFANFGSPRFTIGKGSVSASGTYIHIEDGGPVEFRKQSNPSLAVALYLDLLTTGRSLYFQDRDITFAGIDGETFTNSTYNGLTPLALATGFEITGGTTPKTLTVPDNATVSGTNTGDQTSVTGNAGTATALQTARTINGVSFDGTANITLPATDIQIFTASGTWTKPTTGTPKFTEIIIIGAGGGGGSGRKGAAASARSGGAGGSGGAFTRWRTDTSVLGATETVTVPAGGTGGAAQTTDSTDGNAGSPAASATTFGAWARAGGGNGGTGGTTGSPAGGGGATGEIASSGGGAGNSTTTGGAGISSATFAATGGAAGGGITTGDAAQDGGNGGARGANVLPTALTGGVGATTTTSNGGDGTSVVANNPGGGTGGGGGKYQTGVGGIGGVGGSYGGGGGGGSAGVDATGNSGAGGNGAPGFAIVVTYF